MATGTQNDFCMTPIPGSFGVCVLRSGHSGPHSVHPFPILSPLSSSSPSPSPPPPITLTLPPVRFGARIRDLVDTMEVSPGSLPITKESLREMARLIDGDVDHLCNQIKEAVEGIVGVRRG